MDRGTRMNRVCFWGPCGLSPWPGAHAVLGPHAASHTVICGASQSKDGGPRTSAFDCDGITIDYSDDILTCLSSQSYHGQRIRELAPAIPKELAHLEPYLEIRWLSLLPCLPGLREKRNKPSLAQKSPQMQLALQEGDAIQWGQLYGTTASYGQLFPTAEGRGRKAKSEIHIILRNCEGYTVLSWYIYSLHYDCYCTYS